jgi:hypothetical protein
VTTGSVRENQPTGVVNGTAGNLATGWVCASTSSNPDNATAFALCCPSPAGIWNELN